MPQSNLTPLQQFFVNVCSESPGLAAAIADELLGKPEGGFTLTVPKLPWNGDKETRRNALIGGYLAHQGQSKDESNSDLNTGDSIDH